MEEEFEFDDQRPDEKVVLTRRQHPWVLSKAGLWILILGALVFISILIWGMSKISFITITASVLIIVAYLMIQFFLYRNSLFVLTTHRVIYISQSSLFKRKVQEVELENIFNLQYKIEGVMKSLLNFGSVELTTVGDNDNHINITNIENPHFLYEKISELRKRVVNKKSGRDGAI